MAKVKFNQKNLKVIQALNKNRLEEYNLLLFLAEYRGPLNIVCIRRKNMAIYFKTTIGKIDKMLKYLISYNFIVKHQTRSCYRFNPEYTLDKIKD